MISTVDMQRIIISTIIRNVPADQPSGSLYSFDLSSGKTIQKSTIIEPPHREKDNNLRGGIRGLRGIIVRNDQIILANASEIFRSEMTSYSNLIFTNKRSYPGILSVTIQTSRYMI